MNNTLSDEEIERCTLHNRREILFQLRSMIKRGDRVSVLFQEGKQSFLTVLIDVSEENNTLYFDVGGSPDLNQAFLKAPQSTFLTHFEGIRLQFSVAQGRETRLGNERVFAVPLPKHFLRLQRREVYRLPLPTSKPYTCRIRRGSPEEILLPMHDISVGGVGFHLSQQLNYETLEKLENCWLDLGDNGMLPITLEVRYMNALESRTGKSLWHLGCRFVDLSAAAETQIQRFMARIEAERRTLSAG